MRSLCQPCSLIWRSKIIWLRFIIISHKYPTHHRFEKGTRQSTAQTKLHTSWAIPSMLNISGKLLSPISIILKICIATSQQVKIRKISNDLVSIKAYLLEVNLDSTSIYITRPPKPPWEVGNAASKASFKQNYK